METMTFRQLRLAKEITQEEFAEMCGVHVNTIIAYERDMSKIPIGIALKMCEVLGVSFSDVKILI